VFVLCVWACAVGAAAVLPGLAGAARSRAPALAPANTVVDGPSSDIRSLNGLSVSRDGGGALVYTKTVGAVAHVFLSRLAGGAFQAPVQVDAGLVGPSSQPVVAAGQNGLVLVAFVNAGTLYVAQALSAVSPLSAPAALFTGAANPSISISNFGKAYLAFTNTAGAGGGDVRAAYYFQGQWALEASPLDAVAGDAAGVGTGRPDVTASGDGVGIVAWGERGHIYTRRLTATTPSSVVEQADPPSLDGWSETSASLPSIGTGGDSTFAAVAFQETLSNGSATQSRILVNRLQASMFAGASAADGASTGGPEGADQPQLAVTEYGAGFITSETDGTHQLFAAPLGQGENRGPVERVDSLVNDDAADAVPATAGLISTLIAWQQTPGVSGPAEIRVRYAGDGADLGDEQVVSSPSLGATNADDGLVASPLLYWSSSNELWGAPTYALRIGGAPMGQTTATQMVVPAPLTNGRHSYQLTATNLAGVTTNAPAATVFVDTVPPRATWKLTGSSIVNTREQLRVSYTDPPPRGLPKSAASGVATVYVNWGDGSPRARIRRTTASHVYRRIRTDTITITLIDRAGNMTRIVHKVKIKPKPKPKKHKKGKKAAAVRRAAIGLAQLTGPVAGGRS
jgi:hypothetical protein